MPPVTEPLPVHGASVTTFDRFGDSRGYFNELYNETKYDESLQQDWKQVSFSQSGKHALRGLHCSPYGKFITCTRGAFYDVIADFREGSPTFGRWCGIMLTEHNRKQVYVPARCGHGFFVFEDNTCALYLQEGTMNPANEADTHPFDPLFNVKWPVPEGVIPLMSAKDTIAPTLAVRRPHLATATPRGRVLIIGGSGQVGAALIEAYGEHNCVGTYCASPVPGMVPFDLSKAGADLQKASAMLSGSPPVAPYPSPLLISPAPLSSPPLPNLPESPQISGRGFDHDHLPDGRLYLRGVDLRRWLRVRPGQGERSQQRWARRRRGRREEARRQGGLVLDRLRLRRRRLDRGLRAFQGVRTRQRDRCLACQCSPRRPTPSPHRCGPYGETDPVAPLNVYGSSKLAGEAAVLAADPSALVIRTNVVFGPEGAGANFIHHCARFVASDF